MLLPESCAVALHGQTTGTRAGGAWLGVWRPMQRELRRFRSPGGWLPGKGVWTREGELRLPCATAHAPCGLARLRMRGWGAGGEAARKEAERSAERKELPPAETPAGLPPAAADANGKGRSATTTSSSTGTATVPEQGSAPAPASVPASAPDEAAAAAGPGVETGPATGGPANSPKSPSGPSSPPIPVPLQEAPLQRTLHAEVLPTRTA
jgi:hypothetical protein